MATELKSPTCGECAKASGRIPVDEVHTVYMGECANCGLEKPVASAWDWKLPGERRHPLDWD